MTAKPAGDKTKASAAKKDPPPPKDKPAYFGGREKEIREIAFYLEGAVKGDVRNLLVTGDAGLGKSRLLDKLASGGKLAKKWAWIRLAATADDAGGEPLLFARIASCIRIAAAGMRARKKPPKAKGGKRAAPAPKEPDTPPGAAPGAAASLIRRAMAERLAPAGKRGIVLAIDDAHLLAPAPGGEANRLHDLLEVARTAAADGALPLCLVLAGAPKLKRSLARCSNYDESSFRHVRLDELPKGDALKVARRKAEAAGLKAEAKPFLRDLCRAAGGNPRMLERWCDELLAALAAHPDREHKPLLDAVGERVRHSYFELHWRLTTPRERDLLLLVARALDPKGSFTLQGIVDAAKEDGTRLSSSNAHQILGRLEHKGLLYASSHGKYRVGAPLFGDFIGRIGRLPEQSWR